MVSISLFATNLNRHINILGNIQNDIRVAALTGNRAVEINYMDQFSALFAPKLAPYPEDYPHML